LNPYSGIALIASVTLHGLLAAHLFAALSPAPTTVSQRKGLQLVQVKAPSPPIPMHSTPAPSINAPATHHSSVTPSTAALSHALEQKPQLPKDASALPEILPPPLQSPSNEIASVPAGGQFVSPFASITSQPLGRGSWSSSRAVPPAFDQAQLQRQQEQMQLRSMLMDRLGNWVGWQTQQHADAHCAIRLELANRQAQLSCQPAENEAEVWSVLNGMLTSGPATGENAFCLQLGPAQFNIVACDTAP
jgi:hypothetical protein